MTAWVIQWLHRKNVRSRAMGEDTFTFRVDEELKRQFATAARARDRSAAQLLRDYMRAFVAELDDHSQYEVWFRGSVQAGIDAANAGHLVPHSEVEAEMAARRAATLRRFERPRG